MAELRSYGAGYDGTVTGIGGCPFDMDRLQKEYVGGSITPTKMVCFGETLLTQCNIDVTPEASVLNSDGKNSLDLLASSSYFETSALSVRTPNVHRPGSARASDFWGVIPDNIVVPKLVQKLHQGAIDRIVVCSMAFVDTGGADKPKVVQTTEYTTCFMKFVDPMSYGYLTVFSFSFVKVKITQVDVLQASSGGKNAEAGRYVYEFDYEKGSGKNS